MSNFFENVKSLVTIGVVNKVAQITGIEKDHISTAIDKFLAATVSGVVSKGRNEAGANQIIGLIKSEGFGESHVRDMLELLNDKERNSAFQNIGGSISHFIFGEKLSPILDLLTDSLGLSKSSGKSLLGLVAPMVMNKLAGLYYKHSWSPGGMQKFLESQKASLAGMVPEIESYIKFEAAPIVETIKPEPIEPKPVIQERKPEPKPAPRTKKQTPSNVGPYIIVAIVLLAIAAAVWYFLSKRNAASELNTQNTVAEIIDTVPTTSAIIDSITDANATKVDQIDYNSYVLELTGEIKSGDSIVYPKGIFGFDEIGNLVDSSNNVLIIADSIPQPLNDNLKKYIGRFPNSKLLLDSRGNLVDSKGTFILQKGDYIIRDGFYFTKKGSKLGKQW
ncbi:MAG: DUF937 domain-containing protein [Saprospiraceae bacterium]|nr:DUF937 domain-containing protein [Saprospiraceae bacterium]